MTHAGRANAGFGEPVVEPSCRAVAQIGAQRLMNRAEYLKEDENCTDKGERTTEGIAVLYCTDQNTHGNGESRRQRASKQQGKKPREGKARGSLGQDAEEFPFFAFGQSPQHSRILPQKTCVCTNPCERTRVSRTQDVDGSSAVNDSENTSTNRRHHR